MSNTQTHKGYRWQALRTTQQRAKPITILIGYSLHNLARLFAPLSTLKALWSRFVRTSLIDRCVI